MHGNCQPLLLRRLGQGGVGHFFGLGICWAVSFLASVSLKMAAFLLPCAAASAIHLVGTRTSLPILSNVRVSDFGFRVSQLALGFRVRRDA
jgi:hypothetical protein